MSCCTDRSLAELLPIGVIYTDSNRLITYMNAQAKKQLSKVDFFIGGAVDQLFKLNADTWHAGEQAWINDAFGKRWRIKQCSVADEMSLITIEDISLLDTLDDVRQAFIANVSHELRTPLTVFSGYLEMLREQIPADSQVLADILEQMNVQSQRMSLLVKDLLLLSRLESYSLPDGKQEVINITEMLKDICIDARHLGADKEQVIDEIFDQSLFIKGCAKEIHSAFSNIIFNAVNYTRSGGCISVRWHQKGAFAILEVKDNGIGIPAAEIDRITERFYRVDKARSWNKAGGTGLGLAIVKHVLIRHAAQLEISSVESQGSCFRCLFALG